MSARINVLTNKKLVIVCWNHSKKLTGTIYYKHNVHISFTTITKIFFEIWIISYMCEGLVQNFNCSGLLLVFRTWIKQSKS